MRAFRRHQSVRRMVLLAIVLLTASLLVYLALKGRTGAFPTTGCTIVGSRVVRTGAELGFRELAVIYKGEYQLQYTVNGRPYTMWVNAGWADKERAFVESKVSSWPRDCGYRIRYNPANPSEAYADRVR